MPSLTFQSTMNPWSLHARSPESSMDPVSVRALAPESSMDLVSARAVARESSMDLISVQIERPFVQITGPWTISSIFFAENSSMDPILIHAIVQGPRIVAEEPTICADIGSMDEFESEYVCQTAGEPSNGDLAPASFRQTAGEPIKSGTSINTGQPSGRRAYKSGSTLVFTCTGETTRNFREEKGGVPACASTPFIERILVLEL